MPYTKPCCMYSCPLLLCTALLHCASSLRRLFIICDKFSRHTVEKMNIFEQMHDCPKKGGKLITYGNTSVL